MTKSETEVKEQDTAKELVDSFKKEISKAIVEQMDKIEYKYNNREVLWGYPTKFYEFDELTGGLHDSELTVVAARHSMGKSSFVINTALSLIEQHIPVLFISYEMNTDILVSRFLSTHSEVEYKKIKEANLKERDFDKIAKTMQFLTDATESELLTLVPECTYRYKELADEIRKFKEKNSSGVVIVDYFQLIELTKDEDRYSELTNMAASFKRLAIEINLPILLVSQVSKKREDNNNKRPRLSDLAECDALAQHCDNLIFIYREEYYESEKELTEIEYDHTCSLDIRNTAELIIAKHKNGPTKTCNLLFQSCITKFKNKIKSELF